jgi:hypothetical protein
MDLKKIVAAYLAVRKNRLSIRKVEAYLCLYKGALYCEHSVQVKGPECCTVSRKSAEGMMDATGGLEAL